MHRRNVLFQATLCITLLSCAEEEKCSTQDFDCNFRLYLKEIQWHPPSFERAELLASFGATHTYRISRAVIDEKEDYVASSILRITNHLTESEKEQICNNYELVDKLTIRGVQIKYSSIRQEYLSLLSKTCPDRLSIYN